MRTARGPGRAGARVDGARVGVAARVGLDPAAHPLGAAGEPVEVDVADQGVHLAGALDHRGGDHLRAGAVLGLGGEDEARVAGVARVVVAVVVVDPGRQARAQALDEGQRHGGEALSARLRGEGDVEDGDVAPDLARLGELAGGGEREIEMRGRHGRG